MVSQFQEAIQQTAFKAAYAAGDITLKYFRQQPQIENKLAQTGVWDPVTLADKQAEARIREIITQDFPDHGIIGEEFPKKPTDTAYEWIIDPIDGTRAFIAGLPMWGILIGLLEAGEPIFGLMYQPFNQDLFYGDMQKAYVKTPQSIRLLQCSAQEKLSDAAVFMTTPDMFVTTQEISYYRKIKSLTRTIRYGTDCYGYAALSAGWGDLILEANVKSYDILPLIPMIKGAGGEISAPDGSAFQEGIVVASANKVLHEQALKILNDPSI